MANYNPSTIARIGDLVNGLRVDTSNLAAGTYLAQTQVEIFNVVGRIKIHNLWLEVTTVFSNNACQVLFNWTCTTPSIAVQPLCAKCASVAQLAVGERIFHVGGAVGTAAVITATPGISDINVTPQVVGAYSGTGTNSVSSIGILSSDASLTSGNFRGTIFYTPMSEGAYVTAAL